MTDYTTETFTLREGAFRFGGQVNLRGLREAYYRDPIARWLIIDVIDEAMGHGFIPRYKEDDEIPKWWDQARVTVHKYHDEAIVGIGFSRRDGKCLPAFIKKGIKLFMRSFQRANYQTKYDKFGEITEASAWVTVDQPSNVLNMLSTISPDRLEFKPEEMKMIHELVYRRRETVGSGMSILEPVYDLLQVIYFHVAQAGYAVVKQGSGQKRVTVTDPNAVQSEPVTKTTIQDLVTSLESYGSIDDTIYIPYGIDVNIGGDAQSNYPFKDVGEFLFWILSISTGVPSAHLKGIVPGQLEGAEINQDSYQDFLRDIQQKYNEFWMWYLVTLNSIFKWTDEDIANIIKLDWSIPAEVTDEEQRKADREKAELAARYISLGFSREAAFEKSDIQFEPSDLVEESPEEDDEDENDDDNLNNS